LQSPRSAARLSGTLLASIFTRGCATEVLAQRLARRTFKPGKGAPGRLSSQPLHFVERAGSQAGHPVVSPGKNKVPLDAVTPPKRFFETVFRHGRKTSYETRRRQRLGRQWRLPPDRARVETGEFRRRLCDPLPAGFFRGWNPIASPLAVAGQAVRTGRPPNSSAPDLPFDFYFPLCRTESGEPGAILTEISA
jgi:hypothetical protein